MSEDNQAVWKQGARDSIGSYRGLAGVLDISHLGKFGMVYRSDAGTASTLFAPPCSGYGV